MLRQLRGHIWTTAPLFVHKAMPVGVPRAMPWHTVVEDRDRGPIRLTGTYHPRPGADTVVVLIHGLGGSPDSYYARQAANTVQQVGCAALRLALRGADLQGEDFYHGGLTADIHAAIASDELAGYAHVVILGYSMGGHAALCLATESAHAPDRAVIDSRVRAVAALCAPLDLTAAQQHMDGLATVFYRRFLLRSLNAIYAAVFQRRGGPVSPADAWRIRSFLEFDNQIVAPRFGFADARDYYAQVSVASRLDDLRIPALLVVERRDPIVPPHTLVPYLQRRRPLLDVRWIDRGGHVGFPRAVDLGMDAPRERDAQIIAWLLAACQQG